MKTLKDILFKVPIESVDGDRELKVAGVTQDSRQVKPGYVFVAIAGTAMDGHDYIPKALEQGASVVVLEREDVKIPSGIAVVKVADGREAVAQMAANFNDHPSGKLIMIGITGTNGKTSCATLAYRVFRDLGYNAGLISTIRILINDEEFPSTLTTPDPVALQELLASMAKKGCTHVFMEASSHALVQKRLHGVQFSIGAFTNLTHDHLDYHGTFKDYRDAKKLLFDHLGSEAWALINLDDKNARYMVQNTTAGIKTFGIRTSADFKGKVLDSSFEGQELDFNGHSFWIPLVGSFNASNVLAVYGIAMILGEEEEEVLKILSAQQPVEGRFEQIKSKLGIHAVVDYAHTPDALENVLQTLAEVRTGNETLILVFGCGGNRDKTKRPEMARVATRFADKVIITSDNPRDEEPESIIEDIAKGVSGEHFKKVLKNVDRREAIRMACMMAKPRDILLVAGKGHETYQEVKGKRLHFDDREELRTCFDLLETNG